MGRWGRGSTASPKTAGIPSCPLPRRPPAAATGAVRPGKQGETKIRHLGMGWVLLDGCALWHSTGDGLQLSPTRPPPPPPLPTTSPPPGASGAHTRTPVGLPAGARAVRQRQPAGHDRWLPLSGDGERHASLRSPLHTRAQEGTSERPAAHTAVEGDRAPPPPPPFSSI